MQKSRFACLPFLAILIFVFMAHVGAGQEGGSCTPEFAIYSAETFEAAAGSSIEIDVLVKNTGACAGSTVVIAEVPKGWNKTKIVTDRLEQGESYPSSIKITLPDGAESAIVNLIAPGANVSPVKIVIGGIAPEENASQENVTSEQENETQPPAPNITPIIPAKNDTVINLPQENAQPQPNETEPAQNQPESGSVTGLVTANPSAQIAIFAILVFGAGYLASRIKSEGFRYRFKR